MFLGFLLKSFRKIEHRIIKFKFILGGVLKIGLGSAGRTITQALKLKKSLLYYLNHLFLPDPFLLTMLIALKKTQFLLILTNIVKQNPTLTESDLELIRY